MAKYECPDCQFVYDEEIGVEHEGYPAGTLFEALPEDFCCPNCFVREKEEFIPIETA